MGRREGRRVPVRNRMELPPPCRARGEVAGPPAANFTPFVLTAEHEDRGAKRGWPAGRGLSGTSVRRSRVPLSDAGCRCGARPGRGGRTSIAGLASGGGAAPGHLPPHLGEMNRLPGSHPASGKLSPTRPAPPSAFCFLRDPR